MAKYNPVIKHGSPMVTRKQTKVTKRKKQQQQNI